MEAEAKGDAGVVVRGMVRERLEGEGQAEGDAG